VSDAPCDQTAEEGPHVPPVWHDGTERPIHRPKDPEAQQDHYRGKKKGHTGKNLRVINETCHMGFLSATDEGKGHDNSVAALEGYTLPHGRCLYQDMGFQGFILNGTTIVQPQKRPRGGELAPLRTRPLIVSRRSEFVLNTPLAV
jgi:DDE superfamily endonuclease